MNPSVCPTMSPRKIMVHKIVLIVLIVLIVEAAGTNGVRNKAEFLLFSFSRWHIHVSSLLFVKAELERYRIMIVYCSASRTWARNERMYHVSYHQVIIASPSMHHFLAVCCLDPLGGSIIMNDVTTYLCVPAKFRKCLNLKF